MGELGRGRRPAASCSRYCRAVPAYSSRRDAQSEAFGVLLKIPRKTKEICSRSRSRSSWSNARRRLLSPEPRPRITTSRGSRRDDSSGHAPETLWEDGELVLCRGVWGGKPFPLLAAMPSSAQPSPETLARLQHAYALRGELDPAWAARPLKLEPHQGRLALLIEDPGGEPLLRLLGRPLDIMSFLRLAVGIATALALLHQRGLIFKDIKPANVLINSVTGQAWLTGFGIASRLPRERQAPASPEVIAGTLAYMAPEQTGRMNRLTE